MGWIRLFRFQEPKRDVSTGYFVLLCTKSPTGFPRFRFLRILFDNTGWSLSVYPGCWYLTLPADGYHIPVAIPSGWHHWHRCGRCRESRLGEVLSGLRQSVVWIWVWLPHSVCSSWKAVLPCRPAGSFPGLDSSVRPVGWAMSVGWW